MLARYGIVALMSALVLACPLLQCEQCTGAVCCDDHDQHVHADHGHGHGHDHDQPCERDQHGSEQHPCPHDEGNCFCDGAILPIALRTPADDNEVWLFAATADARFAPRSASLSQDRLQRWRSPFPPLLSGREIRTLVGSHLL